MHVPSPVHAVGDAGTDHPTDWTAVPSLPRLTPRPPVVVRRHRDGRPVLVLVLVAVAMLVVALVARSVTGPSVRDADEARVLAAAVHAAPRPHDPAAAGPDVPAGSVVLLQCTLSAGRYLATTAVGAGPDGAAVVPAAALFEPADTAVAETCRHWWARHGAGPLPAGLTTG